MGSGIFAVNGILFNQESERRGETFVTRKITRAIAKIVLGQQDKIYLGNLNARRDWGYAREFMEAAWLMMQQSKPDDYVIGTGESHSVREFLDESFNYVGISDWKNHVCIHPPYFPPPPKPRRPKIFPPTFGERRLGGRRRINGRGPGLCAGGRNRRIS